MSSAMSKDPRTIQPPGPNSSPGMSHAVSAAVGPTPAAAERSACRRATFAARAAALVDDPTLSAYTIDASVSAEMAWLSARPGLVAKALRESE